MSYKQVHEGGTFGPFKNFPEHCYFKNCTFYATCTFQENCHFIDCTFLDCCPPYYRNPPSQVRESILENCSLEKVVCTTCLLANCSIDNNVTLAGDTAQNPPPKAVDGKKTPAKACACLRSTRTWPRRRSRKASTAHQKSNTKVGATTTKWGNIYRWEAYKSLLYCVQQQPTDIKNPVEGTNYHGLN